MNLNKIIITAFSIIFAGYTNAAVNSSLYVSNGTSEDFLWAPISARYSTISNPSDNLSIDIYNGSGAVVFSAQAVVGGNLKTFTCSLYGGTDALYAEARAIALSLKETSVLEVFKDNATGKCKRVILAQRSDYLIRTGGNIVFQSYNSSVNIPYSGGELYVQASVANTTSTVIAKTDWSRNITFTLNGDFSCNVSPTYSDYKAALEVLNALGNGYTLRVSGYPGQQCSGVSANFSLNRML